MVHAKFEEGGLGVVRRRRVHSAYESALVKYGAWQGAAGNLVRTQAPVLVASAASVGYVGLAAVATGGLPVAAVGAIGAYNAAAVGLSVAFDRGIKQDWEDGAGEGEQSAVVHAVNGGSKLLPAWDKARALGEG